MEYKFNGDTALINGTWKSIRELISELPEEEFNALAKARAIDHFLNTNRFCGRCGAPMEQADDKDIKYAKRCSSKNCEGHIKISYPVYSIAAIIAITRNGGNELLLGHNMAWQPKRVSLLAGFMQPGETLEECAKREIMEESGLRISSIRYVNSQPWPFPSNIMAGFYAEADENSEAKPDGQELDSLYWLTRDEIKNIMAGNYNGKGLFLPKKGSLARKLITLWLNGNI